MAVVAVIPTTDVTTGIIGFGIRRYLLTNPIKDRQEYLAKKYRQEILRRFLIDYYIYSY